MNNLRTIHLYLGCLFAPMLIFFVATGALQTFELHEDRKDGYVAAKIVEDLSEVHIHQRLPIEGEMVRPSFPFKIFVLLMSFGFLLTSVLGIVMAFKYTKKRGIVWVCLIIGVILPFFFLWMARGFK